MKYFFFLLVILLAVSCSEKQFVKISGEIKNIGNKPLLLLNYKISRVPDTIKTENGKFTYEFKVNAPGFRTMKIGHIKKEFFLMPGFDLKISADANNLDSTFLIEGKVSKENVVHFEISKKLKSIDYNSIFSMEYNSAMDVIDSTYKEIKKIFKELKNNNDLHSKFKEMEEASILFHEADMKLSYAIQNEMFKPAYKKFLKDIDWQKEEYTEIPNYRMFLQTFLEFESNLIEDIDSIGSDEILNKKIQSISELKHKKIKEFLVYSVVNEQLEFYGTKNIEPYLAYFKKENKDSVFAKQMELSFAKKNLLSKGNPAPEFACFDKDSVSHSLSDFNGKYVFIDFWATWCPSCRQELRFYLKLAEDFKGKNIAFLSISVDDSKESWLKVVNSNISDVIALFGGKGWSSEAAKAYQVIGIPSFVLIDVDGKIIDSQAPTPSSKEIRPLLDSLLAK